MLYGISGDPFYNLWVFARLAGQKLDVSYLIPNADPNHFILPTQPLIDWQGTILSKAFGPVMGYNFFILLSFVLTFVAAYLLANKIIKNKSAAIFSALLITFLPYRIAQAQVHLNLVSTHWLLFFTYFLISLWEKKRPSNAILLGIFAVLVALDNYQYAFFALLVAITFFVYALIISIKNHQKRAFWHFFTLGAFAFGTFAVLFAIFDFNVVASILTGGVTRLGQIRDLNELKVYSAHWFYYLLPPPNLKFFTGASAGLYNAIIDSQKTNVVEQTIFLGWLPIILACGTAVYHFAKKLPERFCVGFFAILAIVGVCFSIAPEINLFGLKFYSPAYYIFEKFPVIRVYSRVGLIVGISVALLAGFGVRALFGRMRSRVLSAILSVALLILALVEFYPKTILPYQDTGDVPAIYETLAELPHGPVAEYPLLPAEEPLAYVYLVGQLTHLNPLVFGSQADSEGDKLRQEILNPSDPKTIDRLISSGVKYLIVHKDSYQSGWEWKYPKEYNSGVVPEIKNSYVKLIACQEEKCLYELKAEGRK